MRVRTWMGGRKKTKTAPPKSRCEGGWLMLLSVLLQYFLQFKYCHVSLGSCMVDTTTVCASFSCAIRPLPGVQVKAWWNLMCDPYNCTFCHATCARQEMSHHTLLLGIMILGFWASSKFPQLRATSADWAPGCKCAPCAS